MTFGQDLGPSSVIELVGMPALTAWLAYATRPARMSSAIHDTAAASPA